jgi:hypothetical protein
MYSIPLITSRIITCFHLKYLKTVITTHILKLINISNIKRHYIVVLHAPST